MIGRGMRWPEELRLRGCSAALSPPARREGHHFSGTSVVEDVQRIGAVLNFLAVADAVSVTVRQEEIGEVPEFVLVGEAISVGVTLRGSGRGNLLRFRDDVLVERVRMGSDFHGVTESVTVGVGVGAGRHRRGSCARQRCTQEQQGCSDEGSPTLGIVE
jgi:hypothetical protein